MKNSSTTKIVFSILMLALMLVVGTPAFAKTKITATKGASLDTIKGKVGDEIDRRVTSLTALMTRLGSTTKLSDGDKTALEASITQDINDLTTLKTKITTDTDAPTLKTDRKSVSENYRIYRLVIPQVNILAATDRIGGIVDTMNGVITKLQTSITAAQTAGKDVTAINKTIADIQAKVADAGTQSTSASSAVTVLVPDNGNAATVTSNTKALQSARAMIKTATADLKAARTDTDSIKTALTAMGQ